MFSRHTHMGAPVIFGTATVNLHELPPAIAINTLRIAGKRVLTEAKAANAQLKATKAALGRPEATGLLALITPAFRLDRHSVVALVGDAMRDNRCRSIDQLFWSKRRLPRRSHIGGGETASCHFIRGRMAIDFCRSISLKQSDVRGARSPGSLGAKEDYYRSERRLNPPSFRSLVGSVLVAESRHPFSSLLRYGSGEDMILICSTVPGANTATRMVLKAARRGGGIHFGRPGLSGCLL